MVMESPLTKSPVFTAAVIAAAATLMFPSKGLGVTVTSAVTGFLAR